MPLPGAINKGTW